MSRGWKITTPCSILRPFFKMAYGKQDICGWKSIPARGIKHPHPIILSPENGEGEVFFNDQGAEIHRLPDRIRDSFSKCHTGNRIFMSGE
jgi:hypothetical protein